MARHKLTVQEMEYEFARISLIWRSITKILGILIKYGCILGCIYFLFDSIKSFSGKESYANILLDIIFNMRFDKWLGYIFGFGGLLYGAIRHRQLKNTRKELSHFNEVLQKKIDPNRQNSRLNQYGETNDND